MSEEPTVPEGMTPLRYPAWATTTDPDIPHQLTAVAVRLYELFGSGTPATTSLPEFPFSTATGAGSGIDAYDQLKAKFQRIESEFDAAAQAFKKAVQDSAFRTQAGRDAINDAIATFNTTAAALDEGDWDGLLQAESTMLTTVKGQVSSAASQGVPLPPGVDTPPLDPSQGIPLPGVDTAPAGLPPAAPRTSDAGTDDAGGLAGLLSTLGGGASPFGAGGIPMGGSPLAGLGGLNPLGGQGNPTGGSGGNPIAALSNAIKPLSTRTEADAGTGGGAEKSPIAPLNLGPQNPPPTAAPPAEVPVLSEQEKPARPTPTAETRATVTLPDGTVVDAPSTQAAHAAQNALDKASPGGDAAQKAYGPTGLDFPGHDGKNLGAKVDPSAMQPGDVLKWQDKTMVAVAPGLVADPSEPGVTHTLAEVFKDQKGFEGVFRPTETDPTLSTHTTAPPLADPPAPAHSPGQPAPPPPPTHDQAPQAPAPPAPPPANVPAEPPPDSVPLSGPGPAGAPAPPQQPAPQPSSTVPQAAPPSPFESAAPPPATRSTKTERIAAGLE